jgi:hypothetical protein
MRVELAHGLDGRSWAVLRPLTGRDELMLDPELPSAGSRLVDRLLVAASGAAAGPGSVPQLSVSDRDRLLAGLYRAAFGAGIELVAACDACGEKLEVAFTLDALLANQTPQQPADIEGPDGEGFYRLASDIAFRPPVVADIDAVAHLPAEAGIAALLARCAPAAAGTAAIEAVQLGMDAVAPVLDIDIATACPHCQRPQGVPFSLERHLVELLGQERRYLTHEVHCLARAYGWALDDILDLSRDDRRTLVRLVAAEREPRGLW